MNNTTSFNISSDKFKNRTSVISDVQGFLDNTRFAFGVAQVLLAPLITLTNILVIISVLRSKTLRRNFIYQAIVSIATADLLIGLFICPFRAHYMFKRPLIHSCHMLLLSQVIEEFVQMFVGTWGIVSINACYVLTLVGVRFPRPSVIRTRIIHGMSLVLPWLAMLFIVLPIAYHFSGLIPTKRAFCRIHLRKTARMIVIFFTYVIPAIVTVIQAVVMTVIYKYKQRQPHRQLARERVDPPWTLIVASLATVITLFIDQMGFMNRGKIFKLMSLKQFIILAFSAVAISDAKSLAVPLAWFLMPEIRQSIRDLYDTLPWRKTISQFRKDSDFTVSYKDLCEEVQPV